MIIKETELCNIEIKGCNDCLTLANAINLTLQNANDSFVRYTYTVVKNIAILSI